MELSSTFANNAHIRIKFTSDLMITSSFLMLPVANRILGVKGEVAEDQTGKEF